MGLRRCIGADARKNRFFTAALAKAEGKSEQIMHLTYNMHDILLRTSRYEMSIHFVILLLLLLFCVCFLSEFHTASG